MRNPKRARDSDGKYEEQNTTDTPQGHNLDVDDGSAALTRTTTPQGHPDTWDTEASTKRPDITRSLTTMTASQGDISTSAENDYTPIFGIQAGTDTYVLRTEPGTTLGQRPQTVEDALEPDPTGDYHGSQSIVERLERKEKKRNLVIQIEHTNRIIERPVDMTHIHNTHVILHSSLIKTSSGPLEAASRKFSPVSIPKTQHNHCMQHTHFFKTTHSSIRVLACLHSRSEKGKP